MCHAVSSGLVYVLIGCIIKKTSVRVYNYKIIVILSKSVFFKDELCLQFDQCFFLVLCDLNRENINVYTFVLCELLIVVSS